jgi:hypothetical protein
MRLEAGKRPCFSLTIITIPLFLLALRRVRCTLVYLNGSESLMIALQWIDEECKKLSAQDAEVSVSISHALRRKGLLYVCIKCVSVLTFVCIMNHVNSTPLGSQSCNICRKRRPKRKRHSESTMLRLKR